MKSGMIAQFIFWIIVSGIFVGEKSIFQMDVLSYIVGGCVAIVGIGIQKAFDE